MSQETTPGGASPQDTRAPQPPRRTWARPNRWLAIGANLGVLLGLIVLIYEVRQNATISRTAMEHHKNELLAQVELTFVRPEVAEVWVKSFRAPETLTDAEIRMLEGLLVAVMLQWEVRFMMADSNLASRREALQHIENSAPYYFGSPFGKAFWRSQSIGWVGGQMFEAAAPIVNALDETFMADYYDSLLIAVTPPPAEAPDDAPPQ